MKILSFDKNHQLKFESTSISKICNEVETQFYLYRENDILQNRESIINHGKKTGLMPCYALKANYNLRPVIAEILVNNDKYKIIRQRESMKELAERFDWN